FRRRASADWRGRGPDVPAIGNKFPTPVALPFPDREVLAVMVEARDHRLADRTAKGSGAGHLRTDGPPLQHGSRRKSIKAGCDRIPAFAHLRASAECDGIFAGEREKRRLPTPRDGHRGEG